MATTPTPNYGWLLPVPGTEQNTWGPIVNNVFTAIDALRTGNVMTGPLTVPNGAVGAVALAWTNPDWGFYRSGNNLMLQQGSGPTATLTINKNVGITGIPSVGNPFSVIIQGDTSTSPNFQSTMWITSNNCANFIGRRSRGTEASPVAVGINDIAASFQGQAWNGAAFSVVGNLRYHITAATPGAGDMQSRIFMYTNPAGSVTQNITFTADIVRGFTWGNSELVFLDQNGLLNNRSATIAAAHTGAAGKQEYFSDMGGIGGLAIYNSLGWSKAGDAGQTQVNTDANFTLTTFVDSDYIEHTGTLSADRTITLSSTNAYRGAKFHVTRSGAGAFNLSVGGLKNLATGTWCTVGYNGSAWRLLQYGAL